ncbi:hypothetical protein T01_4114 [Trichinella spiralis]|uniref:Rx N-terminal domain-containing protein n=1 Tax=Trichinella spiralis TaxID=6334 RepID=A0A0V1ATG9_TRISP|nr:hypothetical protein T01_4114 [Trichinella spiralis]
MLLLMLLLMVPEEMFANVNLNGASGLIKSILDLEKSVQHTLMLIIQVENSDDAERMRRLLDEVDVLWSHVAEADAVGDYVVTLEKISIKALDSSNKLKLSVDFEILFLCICRFVFGPEKAESLKLEKEKQLIADHLAVLDQEHDRTLGERIWDSSCVEELRKRLQADENKMDVDFIAGGKVHHAQRLTPMFFKLDNKVVDQCKNNHNENRVS